MTISSSAFVSEKYFAANQRSAIGPNNVLISIMGTVGRAGITNSDFKPCMANRAVGIIRPKQGISPGLLFAYINSTSAQQLILAYASGGVQLRINLDLLRQLPVPKFSKTFAQTIDRCIKKAFGKYDESVSNTERAQSSLLASLQLSPAELSVDLTYIARASDVFSAGRMDSQYFAPRVKQLLGHFGTGGQCLADVAPARHERFVPADHGDFRYIEISDVRSDGTTSAEVVEMKDAPSRATWYVRKGDVITSTVRPIRRLSAIIGPEQDGYVASSGFVVLHPKTVRTEVLLTYLRLLAFCELMDLHTSASLYPAISESDLMSLPFPEIPATATEDIVTAVKDAHVARDEANGLLARASQAVEIAVRNSEDKALEYLKGI